MRRPDTDRFGLADVYGWLGFVSATLCAAMAALCCCGGGRTGDAMAAAYGAVLVAALFTGAWGVVMRGTAVGRGLSWIALVVSIGVTLIAIVMVTAIDAIR